MGTSYGPGLVNDGLVAHLDANDFKSYPNSGSIWHDLGPLPNTNANARKFLDINVGTAPFHVSASAPGGQYMDFAGGGTVGERHFAELNAAGGAEDAHFDFGTGDYTHEAVFRPDSVSGWIAIIAKGSAGGTGTAMTINPSGQFGLSIDAPDNTHHHGSGGAISTGQTYHGIISSDRDGNASYYINGVNVENHDISGQNQSVNTNVHWYIGAYNDTNWWFNGRIYFARMYNRALSSSEALQNYHVLKHRFGI